MDEYMIPCVSKTFFGIECLGCGIQRAIVLLFQGDFVAAFYMYPALFPLVLFLGTVAISLIHTTKKYGFWIKLLGFITLTVMVISYFYKHF
ncbi:DUF2752 domain-containing protein [Flavobacterium sp.]|uniref:DUF2752 domain-containing protein n=1 Tax=Flavobacterium sp. TaxID=239 RepID=UPI00260C6BDA|nr:DUF2752 domain-containing protein [Flavobacterium sp.]MDD2987248.1 DUF2752 domain-containing protein [Flavobacterium sp.]